MGIWGHFKGWWEYHWSKETLSAIPRQGELQKQTASEINKTKNPNTLCTKHKTKLRSDLYMKKVGFLLSKEGLQKSESQFCLWAIILLCVYPVLLAPLHWMEMWQMSREAVVLNYTNLVPQRSPLVIQPQLGQQVNGTGLFSPPWLQCPPLFSPPPTLYCYLLRECGK